MHVFWFVKFWVGPENFIQVTYLVICAGVSCLGCMMRLIWPYIVCYVYCRIILLSQISSISSQNRVPSRRNTFFWRIVGESIMSYALDFTVNDRVYVIYPVVSYFFGQFNWSRAKTGYSVTDIRPCTDVWDRGHCQGCLIGRTWPCIRITYYTYFHFSDSRSAFRTGYSITEIRPSTVVWARTLCHACLIRSWMTIYM